MIELRTVSFDIPPHAGGCYGNLTITALFADSFCFVFDANLLSKDSVTVAVDAVVYYRVSDATLLSTSTTPRDRRTCWLRRHFVTFLEQNISARFFRTASESISDVMQTYLDGATDVWGIKVERVEIKDVRLPTEMQRAMATEAEATHEEAKAKVIAAEGEQKASRSLKEVDDVISQSPSALQLRYLQTLTQTAAEKNSTIVFPLPIELLKACGDR